MAALLEGLDQKVTRPLDPTLLTCQVRYAPWRKPCSRTEPLLTALPVDGSITLATTLTFEPRLMERSGIDMVSRGFLAAAATVVIAGAGSAADGAAGVDRTPASWPAQRQRPRAVVTARFPVLAGSRQRGDPGAVVSARLPAWAGRRRCRPERSSRTVEIP